MKSSRHNKKGEASASELRQDIVTGNWSLISPGRAGRPHQDVRALRLPAVAKSDCPFEDIHKAAMGEVPFVQYGDNDSWRVAIVGNKYPALWHGETCPTVIHRGPYERLAGIGRHELVITRDHQKNFSQLTPSRALEVLLATAERVRALKEDKCLAYVLLFQNYGMGAGSSQPHPHYQLITTPVVPPGVVHSLEGARAYFKKNKECAHCAMIAYERKASERVVYENEGAIVFAPFASTYAYEMRVFPKRHQARFEETPEEELADVSLALQKALSALRKTLRDPDYNFLLHTTPIQVGDVHEYYHWHIEIMPRTHIFAGFEVGTGMVINPVVPETAAKLLRASL